MLAAFIAPRLAVLVSWHDVFGLAMIPGLLRVLRIPQSILMAGVVLLSTLGTFAVQRQVFDIWQMWFFGLLGYAMRQARFPLAPLIIGFVLGPIFEVNIRRTTIVAGDDFIGFLGGRPIALLVFSLIVLALIFPFVQAYLARRRREQFTAQAD